MTKHQRMVRKLVKSPWRLQGEITPIDLALIHAILGIAGECGEIVDAIKKVVIYRQPINIKNIIEELGDLEFYIEDLRRWLKISRTRTIKANITKLAKRYPGFVYTDKRAKTRLDKICTNLCNTPRVVNPTPKKKTKQTK